MEHAVATRSPMPVVARERHGARVLPTATAACRVPPAPLRAAGMRLPAIAAIAALHAAVLYMLLADTRPVRHPPRPAVQVELIAALPAPEPPRPTAPPRVLPTPRQLAPPAVDAPPPILAIESPRLAESTMPDAPPVPVEIVPASAASAAPAPALLTPPRFDAAYLDNPAPAYPALARRQREEGRVLLRVLVGADGRAERVEIALSSGSERLDRAAQDAVRRWRFVPARRGDEAVVAHVTVPVVFTLDRA